MKPEGRPFYGFDPTDGLHILRNKWTQRSYLEEQARALASGLDVAVDATRKAVPHRDARGKDFRIDPATHLARSTIEAMDPMSQERRMEQLLYRAYGPAGGAGPTDLWGQLIAFQVPVFGAARRGGWGHIDLLALGHDGRPVVIELKKQDSRETPLRAIVEGLANAIAVEESWPAMCQEVRAMCARRGLGCPVAETATPITVVALAPSSYWQSWEADGSLGCRVQGGARDEVRRLREAISRAGYPTRLAAFDWPFESEPRVRAAAIDW